MLSNTRITNPREQEGLGEPIVITCEGYGKIAEVFPEGNTERKKFWKAVTAIEQKSALNTAKKYDIRKGNDNYPNYHRWKKWKDERGDMYTSSIYNE